MNQSKLLEGGNVFKGADKQPLTQRIATADVESTVDYIEKITGLDFTKEKDLDDKKPVKWLGTTGRKEDPYRYRSRFSPRWQGGNYFLGVTSRGPLANRSAGMAPNSPRAARTSPQCGIGHRDAVPPPYCRMVCSAGCHRSH